MGNFSFIPKEAIKDINDNNDDCKEIEKKEENAIIDSNLNDARVFMGSIFGFIESIARIVVDAQERAGVETKLNQRPTVVYKQYYKPNKYNKYNNKRSQHRKTICQRREARGSKWKC